MLPDKLDRLCLPSSEVARLRDLVRHRDRLTEATSARKTRIHAMIGQIQPTLMEALGTTKFLNAYRAFLRTYVDPRQGIRLGKNRLHRFLDRRHGRCFDPERTEKIFRAARSGAQLLDVQLEQGGSSSIPIRSNSRSAWSSISWRLRRPRSTNSRSVSRTCITNFDPGAVLQTLPGVGPIIAAGVLGETGTIDRFPNVGSYRGYVSLIPRYKATGKSHNPRQRIRKAGPRILKKYFYLAAENARKCDLELAAFYTGLRHKGRVHDQAVCAVANKLAGRAYEADEPGPGRSLRLPRPSRPAHRERRSPVQGPERVPGPHRHPAHGSRSARRLTDDSIKQGETHEPGICEAARIGRLKLGIPHASPYLEDPRRTCARTTPRQLRGSQR